MAAAPQLGETVAPFLVRRIVLFASERCSAAPEHAIRPEAGGLDFCRHCPLCAMQPAEPSAVAPELSGVPSAQLHFMVLVLTALFEDTDQVELCGSILFTCA